MRARIFETAVIYQYYSFKKCFMKFQSSLEPFTVHQMHWYASKSIRTYLYIPIKSGTCFSCISGLEARLNLRCGFRNVGKIGNLNHDWKKLIRLVVGVSSLNRNPDWEGLIG